MRNLLLGLVVAAAVSFSASTSEASWYGYYGYYGPAYTGYYGPVYSGYAYYPPAGGGIWTTRYTPAPLTYTTYYGSYGSVVGAAAYTPIAYRPVVPAYVGYYPTYGVYPTTAYSYYGYGYYGW